MNAASTLNSWISPIVSDLQTRGQHTLASKMLEQSLEKNKELLGESHPEVAISLINTARSYKSQGHYAEADIVANAAVRSAVLLPSGV